MRGLPPPPPPPPPPSLLPGPLWTLLARVSPRVDLFPPNGLLSQVAAISVGFTDPLRRPPICEGAINYFEAGLRAGTEDQEVSYTHMC